VEANDRCGQCGAFIYGAIPVFEAAGLIALGIVGVPFALWLGFPTKPAIVLAAIAFVVGAFKLYSIRVARGSTPSAPGSTDDRTLLNMFDGGPQRALRALARLKSMPQSDAIAVLLEGVSRHPSAEVRRQCLGALLPYELDEQQLAATVANLDHPSAAVRHAALSYIGLRGSQGRPVLSVLPRLVEMLSHVDQSTDGVGHLEEVTAADLPLTIASAIKATVGAQRVMPNHESFDLSGFRDDLVYLKDTSDPINAIDRADAQKYLDRMFGV
jgi:hypothetical protein